MSISERTSDPLTEDQVEQAKRLANAILDDCSAGYNERVILAGLEYASAMVIVALVKNKRQEASAKLFHKNLLIIMREARTKI